MQNYNKFIETYSKQGSEKEKLLLLQEFCSMAPPADYAFFLDNFNLDENITSVQMFFQQARKAKENLYDSLDKQSPEPYLMNEEQDGVYFYSCPKIDRKSKKLIIAVTGSAGVLMMPMGIFLQNHSATNVDLLSISINKHFAFRQSDQASLNEINKIEFVSNIIKEFIAKHEGYSGISVIGTSKGALPAVLIGKMINAEYILAVGAGSPYKVWWEDVTGMDPIIFLKEQGLNWGAKTTLAYGAQSKIDEDRAREIAEFIPVERVPISSANGSPSMHTCLHYTIVKNEFPEFMERYLGIPINHS